MKLKISDILIEDKAGDIDLSKIQAYLARQKLKTFIIKTYNDQIIYETEARSMKEAVEKAYIEKVDLINAYLYNTNLKGANLQGIYLSYAYLCRSNLRGANLQEANLMHVDLERSNLQGADLRGADLRSAFLFKADLRGANLEGTMLGFAILYAAKLSISRKELYVLTNSSDYALGIDYRTQFDMPL